MSDKKTLEQQPSEPQYSSISQDSHRATDCIEAENGALDKGQSQPITQASHKRWSRRRFISALGSGAAFLLAACGRERPTPVSPIATPPTPTAPVSPLEPNRSPLATPSATATKHKSYLPNIPNEIEEPTATPTITDTPTATPVPPTPTPIATPFPPGPPSKLGLFVARNHPQIFDLLKTKAITVVKTLELDANFALQIKETSPNTLLIGRIDLPQIQLANLDSANAARAFVEKVLPFADDPRRRPHFDGWEAYNEPIAGSDDEMKRLSDFEAERTRLLGERGIRSVIGNFGTGTPDLERWQHFLPAVQSAKENNGWLGLHEYSAPTIYYLSTREDQGRYPGVSPEDSGWLTLRYRKVYNEILRPAGLEIPLVFTELGVDGLVANRPGPPQARGWQHFQEYWAQNGYGLWGPGAYVEQLAWYDAAMRQDSYVLGGCIYAMAASGGWESYDILGPVGAVLEQYLGVHAP